jgi:hypothetical protein
LLSCSDFSFQEINGLPLIGQAVFFWATVPADRLMRPLLFLAAPPCRAGPAGLARGNLRDAAHALHKLLFEWNQRRDECPVCQITCLRAAAW